MWGWKCSVSWLYWCHSLIVMVDCISGRWYHWRKLGKRYIGSYYSPKCTWIYNYLQKNLIKKKKQPARSSVHPVTPKLFHIPFGCCSVPRLCLTLWDPTDCSTPGSSVLPQLLEFVQVHVLWVCDAIQPSHPLPPPSPFAFSLSQHQEQKKVTRNIEMEVTSITITTTKRVKGETPSSGVRILPACLRHHVTTVSLWKKREIKEGRSWERRGGWKEEGREISLRTVFF